MTFLPIVARELRVASRKKKIYRARYWSVVGLTAVGMVFSFGFANVPEVPGGPMMLSLLAGACFSSCFGLSANTVDCVTEEKREGTLGFLFLTDLKGIDIALGKLFATSLNSFYAMMGVLPVVAVALLMGGVTGGELWEVALGLLNFLFFAQTAALFFSTVCRTQAGATIGTGLVLSGSTAGLALLAALLKSMTGNYHYFAGALAELLNPASCVYWACARGFGLAGRRIGMGFFWSSLGVVHLTGWLFLGLASWRLPHCWQEAAGPARLRWRERFRQWTYGRPDYRKARRQKLAGINPFLWLASRNRLDLVALWSILGVLLGMWVWMMALAVGDDIVGIFVVIVIVHHVLLTTGVAVEAARRLEQDRRNGALEFLLCATPLQPEDILAGQWRALRRLFLWPAIYVLVLDAILAVVAAIRRPGFENPEDRAGLVWFISAAIVVLTMDLWAAGWGGMWRGMARRRKGSAGGETMVIIFGGPIAAFMLMELLLHFLAPRLLDGATFNFVLLFFCAASVPAGVWYWARRKLLTDFRALAATQGEEPPGLLGRLGRMLGRMAR